MSEKVLDVPIRQVKDDNANHDSDHIAQNRMVSHKKHIEQVPDPSPNEHHAGDHHDHGEKGLGWP